MLLINILAKSQTRNMISNWFEQILRSTNPNLTGYEEKEEKAGRQTLILVPKLKRIPATDIFHSRKSAGGTNNNSY